MLLPSFMKDVDDLEVDDVEQELAEINYKCNSCNEEWETNYTHCKKCIKCNSMNIKETIILE